MNNTTKVLTIFAGTNGAGKSTISNQMRQYIGTIIDPDAIAREMNPSNPREVDLSAGKEAVKRIRKLLSDKMDFAIETTLSGSFAIRHMHLAKEQGYTIVLYYIGLEDVEMHIDRVASRVQQGGHWIAESDIRWRYGQSLKNLIPAIHVSDKIFIIDNTLNHPIMIAESEQNRFHIKVPEPPQWAIPVIHLFH
jgi:predicted ABC-type ATPase